MTTNVPYNCKTTFTELFAADGWAMGEIDEVIIEALHEASASYFKTKPAAFYGMGSTTTWKPTIHD